MNGMQSPSLNQLLHDCSAICGIYQWGHNMAFSEAWQLKGIFAFVYPTDFSGCHTPLQFHRNAINCPCVGPGDSAAIVPRRQRQSHHNVPSWGLACSSAPPHKTLRPGPEGAGRKEGMCWANSEGIVLFPKNPKLYLFKIALFSTHYSPKDQKMFKETLIKWGTHLAAQASQQGSGT